MNNILGDSFRHNILTRYKGSIYLQSNSFHSLHRRSQLRFEDMKQVAHLPAQQSKALIFSLFLVLFETISSSRVAFEQGIQRNDVYQKEEDRKENNLFLPMTKIQIKDEIPPEGHIESDPNNSKGNYRFISLSKGRLLLR